MQTYYKINPVVDLLHIEKQGNKQLFIARTFNYLRALWDARVPTPSSGDYPALIPLLARWLRAAPVASPMEMWGMLTARKSILSCVHAADIEVDAFLAMAFGELPPFSAMEPLIRRKMALMASIDSNWNVDLKEWQEVSCQEMMLYAAAALSDEPISKTGQIRFNAVIESLAKVEPVTLPFFFFGDIASASYLVSYATVRNKYAAKKTLIRQARLMLREQGISDLPPRPLIAGTSRPRISIVSEKYFGEHAMHRCYGELLAGLKEHFNVTLFAESRSPCHETIAHQLQYFEPHSGKLGQLIVSIEQSCPDILLFPSIGMTPWTVALSSMRLAPLQVSLIGHPAPACSEHIDYLALPESMWSPDGSWYEPPLKYAAHPVSMAYYDTQKIKHLFDKVIHREPSKLVRIGINASSMKLNAFFLSHVQRVVDANAGKVILRFFPNLTGIRHASIKRRLESWFPDVEVLPITSFESYMENLSQCDFILQSFPFGGTNTTFDALALGLPVICLNGPEIHSTIDAAILRKIGLDISLLAADLDQYHQIANRLIDHPEERKSIGGSARDLVISAMNDGEKQQRPTLSEVLLGLTSGNRGACEPLGNQS